MFTDHMIFTPELAPRRDRLEAALARGLQTGATRTALRDTVYQLVDYFRGQGMPSSRGVQAIMDCARRAVATRRRGAVGDRTSPIDVLQLIHSWCERRYTRDD